ncbi:MAG: DegT/DnrJ/EryC1/StrS family aminotransferase [Candidatus Omnitrophota bacterium]|jgi:dTDP-4-amino-4,6-dideoxygalactose transaminase
MNRIPMLDLKKQAAPIRAELEDAVRRVMDNNNFILGSEVDEFERDAQRYCGVNYAVGVCNGTDAIRLSLLALGIKSGDSVICPAFTYYATAGAIAAMGAIPVFADIDPDTYNISAESIEKVCKKGPGRKAKAVVPVHLYGQCADMGAIMRIAGKYKLKVVEDTAQAFGAEYKGRKAGSIGDCGSVSFFPGKNLGAFGDAGMVLTNNKRVAEKLRLLRNQGNKDRYYHLVLGHNNRMDGIQAAVLKVKLKYLDSWNKARQDNAAYFNRMLRGVNVKTPFVPEYTSHIYHQYVLRVDSLRDKLLEYLTAKGIDARVFYPVPLHLQKCFRYLGYKRGDLPESERGSRQTIAIPVHPDLTDEEKGYIVTLIKGFLG